MFCFFLDSKGDLKTLMDIFALFQCHQNTRPRPKNRRTNKWLHCGNLKLSLQIKDINHFLSLDSQSITPDYTIYNWSIVPYISLLGPMWKIRLWLFINHIGSSEQKSQIEIQSHTMYMKIVELFSSTSFSPPL